MRVVLWCVLVLLLYGCKKENATLPPVWSAPTDTTGFIKYTIPAGNHYATQNTFQPIETRELQFVVWFDSSAIYQSATAENQSDINKLYGFSDNGAEHHQYSARMGWRWSAGALRLFAYVYNAGDLLTQELGPVPIGAELPCRIKIAGDRYEFTAGAYQQQLPRHSTTAVGKGYLLYPYFGGDEPAPHDVTIWIKALPTGG